MRDAMREHVGLAGAGAGDDEQRLRAVRLADAMLDREPLRVVEVGQGRGANRGEHVGRKQGLRGGGKGGRRRGESECPVTGKQQAICSKIRLACGNPCLTHPIIQSFARTCQINSLRDRTGN